MWRINGYCATKSLEPKDVNAPLLGEGDKVSELEGHMKVELDPITYSFCMGRLLEKVDIKGLWKLSEVKPKFKEDRCLTKKI